MSTTTELELRDLLNETMSELERIQSAPAETATVLESLGDQVRIAVAGGTIAMQHPRDTELVPGQAILVNPQTKQFLRTNPFNAARHVAAVTEVIGDRAVIEHQGQRRLVQFTGTVQPTDRVLLDDHVSFVLEVVPSSTKHTVPDTGVCWDDIGGNVEAKNALREAIEYPYLHPELFAHYGADPSGGVLLYGPPGCGKTMLAKAAATAIGAADGFISCKGPEVLDPYVGVAEATIRELFTRARRFKQRTGRRAVIFIDEAEAILGDRNGKNSRWTGMEKTLVPTFLAEMDGVEESGATIILATNRSTSLDTAVVRPGRIDVKVKVARPNAMESYQIMLGYLERAPVLDERPKLAADAVAVLFRSSYVGEEREVAGKDFVSGALLKNVVDKAKSLAMRRDLESGVFSGILANDLNVAVSQSINELQATAVEQYN